MFQQLDPLLHSQLRLSIMSLLVSLEEAEFTFLKEKTQATSGNLSVQIEKLQAANYIKVEKSFKGKYPLTKCSITSQGIKAFDIYVQALHGYISRTV